MSAAPELAAVLLGLAYLVLAIRERRSCWIFGGLASLLFLGIFWRAGLPMQALLQLYYAAIAVHGWLHWGKGSGQAGSEPQAPVQRCNPGYHLAVLAALAALSLVTIGLRETWGDTQAWLDTVSSWGGVLATWMLARKILEAWLYWIAIDALTVILYIDAGLLPSSALYMLYTVLAFLGWRQWLNSYRQQTPN